ncbi:MAG: chemotaxis protein CheW [Plectolyngbya sp. WJT66-NPBG17]|jgi:purine-binding chemotaxis protein CheW|nr:chemotaxis protein CheW [Plectolyngbya sp. WJT66-NPBG17]
MTQQFCTFYLNRIYFGIPIQQVQEIVRHQTPTRVPLAESDVCGLINLRGQIITVINLKRRLDMLIELSEPSFESAQYNSAQYNVVIRAGENVVSLQIDQLDDILELSDDDFEPPPATLQGTLRSFLQGVYKLANGFLLVLDPAKLLEVKP